MASPFREIRFKGTEEEVEAQWLEARRKGIGGSDAAAVLGMSKYATPLTVWLDKTGRAVPDDLSGNESVYWGGKHEPTVAQEFASRHPGMSVKRKNAILVSKEHPWMLASVDRVIADADGRRGILEIKTCDKSLADDWAETVPDYYIPQPTHYLAVTGYAFFAVAVLIGGNRYKEYFFERDEADIAALVEREREFWHGYVLADTMPGVSGSKADTDALVDMHPSPEDSFIEVLDQDMPELSELKGLNAEIERLEGRRRRLGNEIKARIGDSKGVITPTHKVTWVRSKSTSFDRARFDADHPHLYDGYTTVKPKDGGLRISEVK